MTLIGKTGIESHFPSSLRLCASVVKTVPGPRSSAMIGGKIFSEPQQLRRIPAQNHLPLFFTHPHGLQALQHFGDAADLVRIVAAGKDLAGAAEADGQLESARIEVDGIE